MFKPVLSSYGFSDHRYNKAVTCSGDYAVFLWRRLWHLGMLTENENIGKSKKKDGSSDTR